MNVYDQYDRLWDYLSGEAFRTWFVLDNSGVPLKEWAHIMPDDFEFARSYQA